MERKLLSLEKHVTFLYDELETKEVEIDDLKKHLDEANDKCKLNAAFHVSDQEDISTLKKLTEEQKVKISCLRKHREEILSRHENIIDDYEAEFRAKELDIKNLQDIVENQKQQIRDLKEENNDKLKEIEEQKKTVLRLDLKSSQTSLSEELKMAKYEEEKKRLEVENEDLKTNIKKSEVKNQKRDLYFIKLEDLSKSLVSDAQRMRSSLEKCQSKVRSKCNLEWECNRIFCTLDHAYLYRKVNNVPNVPNTKQSVPVFKCGQCADVCQSKSQLEAHVRSNHGAVTLFQCEKCPFKCNQKNKLTKHLSMKHATLSTKRKLISADESNKDEGIQEVEQKKLKENKDGAKKVKENQRRNKINSKKLANSKFCREDPEILETSLNRFEKNDEKREDNSIASQSNDSEFSTSNSSEQSILESESGEEDSIQSGGMS